MSARPIGLGCMRLSTSDDVDDAQALDTIVEALRSGATWLDTAAAYGKDARDAHANEALIARALAAWGGGRTRITIVTKGGLVREGDRYVAEGRASHLHASCEASREALGGAPDLYLLHAVDPRTSLETSVRALDALRRAGKVRAIGLSNVSLAELDRACAITEIAAVEIALGPFDDLAIRSGLVRRCAERGITIIAHSPLGGPKRAGKLARDPVLAAIATRHGVTAAQIVIAWLRDLSPAIVPIPGARTADAARAMVDAAAVALSDADRSHLDARFTSHAQLRTSGVSRRPRDDAPGEVVILMGVQGAGKTTIARELAASGHERLNRDELGGTLRGLVPRLERALASGRISVVLDNTYATRASRNDVVEAAWRHGVPVRCAWLDTPIEIAQANVARRMIEAHGRLLEPAEIEVAGKKDASILPPRALFRFRRELEPPSPDEGFRAIDVVPFARRERPGFERAGLIVALDAIALLRPPYASMELALERISELARDRVIAAIGWAPVSSDAERVALDACLDRLRSAIPALDVRVCRHVGGPPVCWCRPPLPGLAVALIEHHRLDPSRTTIVGTHASQRTIAAAVGAKFERLPEA